ncbi:MAG: phosphoribosylformylglycinamidine synthase subunit PurQ [Alphaproteobacteria bacterium]|nr:phosphoribosylformylglycinamidine synthase subunit PurQ [Alphaproteobacteria bacterium]
MKSAVVVFPASNCDRDAAVALQRATGKAPRMLWHAETDVPDDLDLIVLPGGFSFGDYLRCGAMAAHSPIMRDIVRRARAGTPVLGICNGFQILCETGLLPGVLMRNASLRFVCKPVALRVEETQSLFTRRFKRGEEIKIPVAHGDGNYFADEETLDRIEGEGRVALRYAPGANPNGAARDIAGILSENRRILGLMPHPERAADAELGLTDGSKMFASILEALP